MAIVRLGPLRERLAEGDALGRAAPGVAFALLPWMDRTRQRTIESERRQILDNAKREAENTLREARLQASEEALRQREQSEKSFNSRMQEVQSHEQRLVQRETRVAQQLDEIARQEKSLRESRAALDQKSATLDADQRSVNRWFDTGAFAAPAFFTFGNSPRSGLRGAPVLTTDLTLEKSFQLRERWKMDLRSEFYNVLNHANFNAPGRVLGSPEFGVVTTARPGRTAQLSARISF